MGDRQKSPKIVSCEEPMGCPQAMTVITVRPMR